MACEALRAKHGEEAAKWVAAALHAPSIRVEAMWRGGAGRREEGWGGGGRKFWTVSNTIVKDSDSFGSIATKVEHV